MSHLGRGTPSHIYVGRDPMSHLGRGDPTSERGDPFPHLCRGDPISHLGRGDMHFAFTKEDFLLKLNIFSFLPEFFDWGSKLLDEVN